jgi:hypothetical protein
MRLSTLVSTALVLVVAGGLPLVASGQANDGPLPFVDSDGAIRFPGRVRDDDNWVHLGSWGSADLNSADPGQHDVYTQRTSLEGYRKTGKFPDGAVIVKEVRKIESGYMTTGPVTWAGDEVLWFVLIKDTKGRFPGNDHWGEGWGWALFNAGATEKNASINFRASCLGCHIPAKETDWIYVKGYPRLRAVHARPEQE